MANGASVPNKRAQNERYLQRGRIAECHRESRSHRNYQCGSHDVLGHARIAPDKCIGTIVIDRGVLDQEAGAYCCLKPDVFPAKSGHKVLVTLDLLRT